MTIEVMEHTPKGLISREKIKVNVIFSTREIVEAYPAHEIISVTFFHWGEVSVYIRRKQ